MEFVSGNIFVREMAFETAGAVITGHSHNFDHVTYVARGAIRIDALDADGAVTRTIDKAASANHNWVLIRAQVCHRITALEDGTIAHCIYSHRNPQGEVVVEYDGWMPAYSEVANV